MGNKYCTYGCGKTYGENPSLYETLYHTTEHHGTEVNKLFDDLVVPHVCAGCLDRFEAGLQYRPEETEFLIDAYCNDCIDENPVRKLVVDQVSRSVILHMRNQLRFNQTLRIIHQLPQYSERYVNFRDNREFYVDDNSLNSGGDER